MSLLHAQPFAAHLLSACLLTCAVSAQWTGEYPFDQSSGTTALDISPAGNSGSLINFGASPWVTGMFGNALQFAVGVDDYVELPAASSHFPVYDGHGSPYSIAYWIKAPNVGGNQGGNVYTEAHDNTVGLRALFMLHGGGSAGDKVRLLIRTDTPNNVVLGESISPVYDDTWHHVVVTEASGTISIYVDGLLDNTLTYVAGREPGTTGFTTFSFNRFSIGAVVRGNGIIDELDGTIDDFRLYDFELSLADVGLVMAGLPLLPTRSSIAEYGVGCASSSFDLAVSGSAAIGGPGVQLQMQGGVPNTIAFLMYGTGQAVLFDLGLVGFPGCTAYPANFVADVTGILDPNGAAPPLLVPIPNNGSLLGEQFVVQGAALDLGTFAAEFSDAGILMLGL